MSFTMLTFYKTKLTLSQQIEKKVSDKTDYSVMVKKNSKPGNEKDTQNKLQ